ncbi:bacteriophage Gp15 family protein [Vagococcus sp. PNs007]|uniref:Bacteriophage Gp15 family protein n=1 Tax=Vagococcus proximus TaxID=2991417 RepID=A0ABT5X2R2_9ENTE|nr:Gp15 family bacteriophage protein [Vagococcus proximus]MDF0480270.1 bacteriophage Gp15 family protein [Vagococcus proximus]
MYLSLSKKIRDVVSIGDMDFELDMAFSNVLRWYEVFEDEEEEDSFKVNLTLSLLTTLTVDKVLELQDNNQVLHEALFIELVKYVLKSDEIEPLSLENETTHQEPMEKYYDLVEDSDYIYASFLQDYGIDLLEVFDEMHWFKFMALLGSLSDKTTFKNVIEIRQMEIPKDATAKERMAILESKQSVALKSNQEAIAFQAMDLLEKREWALAHMERGDTTE